MSWTTERWAQIERVFHAVAQAEPPVREQVLRRECDGDDTLRTEVERLLSADGDDGDAWLDRGIGGALPADPLQGTRFGPFELVDRLADGGMGTVWRARRVGADFDQVVAVKLLRLGLSTPAMRERFARERQTLARLVHPNVARLLDGGTTADGVPFFAMELVDGEPLDRFADSRRLDVRARVRLLAQVCRAVQFAHQNLVVHLDLKPSNILVDRDGVPKLLDFGVAGLLSDIAGDSDVPATRSRPLTPEYASPEQLRGEPVSTAADVFALGVVLYELLAGRRPFASARGDLELARAVVDTEPPRPSATLGATEDPTPTAAVRAAQRASTPRELQRCLRGDLDRIVALAMAKQPQHRYASAQDFAADLERWLGGFPVHAREPAVADRLAKFVRRNKAWVGAALVVVASLLLGIATAVHAAHVARQERDLADAAKRRAEHDADHARIEAASNHLVAEFLGDTFLSAGVVGQPAERARVLATIERRAEQVRRQHAGSDHLRANLLHALGRACAAIDAFALAEALLGEAAAIRHGSFGEHSLEYALSLGSLGQLHFRQGRFEDAVTALREAYRLHRECAPDVHTDVALAANDLAAVERALGNVAQARALHQDALALRRESGDLLLTAESLNNLANSEPDLDVARRLLAEAHALRQSVLGDDDPLTLQSVANLGTACLRAGDLDAARQHLQVAVDRSRPLGALGADGLAVALRTLAYVHLRMGAAPAARAAIDEAIGLERQRLGDRHPRVASALEVRAKVEERENAWPAAIATWREVVALRTAVPPLRQEGLARLSLGAALVVGGDPAGGLLELDASLALLTTKANAQPGDILDCQRLRAMALGRLGRAAEAALALQSALQALGEPPADAQRAATLQEELQRLRARDGR